MISRKQGGIVLALAAGGLLLIAVSVGVVLGVAAYSLSHSGAATAARTYLRAEPTLAREIGPVNDFGAIVYGSVNESARDGDAVLQLKVIGAQQTVYATVYVSSKENRGWRVVGAEYTDSNGRLRKLLDPYGGDGIR